MIFCILVNMLKPDFFLSNSIVHFCVTVIWHKKYTTKKFTHQDGIFFASSVDALQNTRVVSKQKVSNEYDRKPDSAPLGILLYFWNLSSVTVLT